MPDNVGEQCERKRAKRRRRLILISNSLSSRINQRVNTMILFQRISPGGWRPYHGLAVASVCPKLPPNATQRNERN